MESLLGLRFWVVVLVAVVGLRWATKRPTLWFGAVNLGALWLLGGEVVVVAAGLFALAAWSLLFAASWLRRYSQSQAREANSAVQAGARAPVRTAVAGSSSTAVLELPATAAGDRQGPSALAAHLAVILSLAAVLLPLALFFLHKLVMEQPTVAAWFQSGGALHSTASVIRALQILAFSYVVLRYLEAAHCVLWKRAPLLNPLALCGFLFPFHMLLSGPVNRYDEHLKMDTSPLARPGAWLLALNDITSGLCYKYVLAEHLRAWWFGPNQPLTATSWFDTAVLFFYLFFDFAGYSRVALGVGRLLGVPTPINFKAPFLATTVTDFFTRWHMSLGTFILRNIYTPLQLFCVRRWGVKRALWGGLAALLASWLAVGLWHRLTVLFLVYGLAMAGIVWLEKLARDRLLKQPWTRSRTWGATARVLGPIYVFLVMTTMIHLVIKEVLAS